MTLHLSGIHHVSALSADIAKNHDFYTRILGLRLVKKTVNQESATMYHLFYADGAGSPGTDMTFFDFPHAAHERRGYNAVNLTTFRVTGQTVLTVWQERLRSLGVAVSRREIEGRDHLFFEDGDRTRLALFDDGGMGPRGVPNPNTDIPSEYQLQGLGYSSYAVAHLAPTREFLERGLNMREVRQYAHGDFSTYVFAMGTGGPHAELHFTERSDLSRQRPGAGGVHHIALRVKDVAELQAWLAHLAQTGYRNSGQIDRHFFQSVYIREPNGLVIELATEGPGFAINEMPIALGDRLSLPPFLEPRRAEIEAKVRPL